MPKKQKNPKRLMKGLFLRYITKKVLITLYQNLCSFVLPPVCWTNIQQTSTFIISHFVLFVNAQYYVFFVFLALFYVFLPDTPSGFPEYTPSLFIYNKETPFRFRGKALIIAIVF